MFVEQTCGYMYIYDMDVDKVIWMYSLCWYRYLHAYMYIWICMNTMVYSTYIPI